jgi:glycosyltransferase involved in cell wall biosynthesis
MAPHCRPLRRRGFLGRLPAAACPVAAARRDQGRQKSTFIIGEINERQKTKFLGEAAALLFPADWPEPFGLVMIEAMACGTPVLAFRCGSIPEVIEDGITGKMVDSEEEAIAARSPRGLPAVRRKICRPKNGQQLCQYLSPVVEDAHV